MLTQEQIKQLEAFDGQDNHVLSVYLDLDPASWVRRAYLIAFEDLAKAARARVLGEPAETALSSEAERVKTWLESHPPHGKGLAVFTCAPRGLWRAEVLGVRVMNHLAFDPRPDVAPLLRLVDEYERYAVAVVDKQKARLFSVFLGEIEETEELKEHDVPSKHDQGGVSQAKYQRHHEWHVYGHLKRVGQRLADLFRRRRFDRLVVMGPEEAASELRRLLPRALAHRVVAVVPGQLFASDREILDKTLEIERRVERQVEEAVITELLDLVGPTGRAILGVRPTLAALWTDQVQTLVVAHSIRGDGSECPNCERLDPGRIERCPTCGTTMRPVHDLFHRAMARAVEQAGSVEVVHGLAEKRLMEVGGGLGALLRHPGARATADAVTASA
jgi:peptide chain release factor subunit 1